MNRVRFLGHHLFVHALRSLLTGSPGGPQCTNWPDFSHVSFRRDFRILLALSLLTSFVCSALTGSMIGAPGQVADLVDTAKFTFGSFKRQLVRNAGLSFTNF